ncbi:hypothetical protein J7S20_07190 [Sphingomonadaceae bacterium LXI357]|uniref:Uncharacterized protein n=2 Tax=Stakelama marina TaxID=2826939 RepID=A0A8T4IEK9_9SPHN|nr:hypothetical protein [Stakelama marina]
MTVQATKHVPRWPVWRIASWSAVAMILLLPLVAMQFTREVDWTPLDFVAAAVLLGGGVLALERVMRIVRRPRMRAIAALAILGTVALLWAQGAVGIV